MRLKFVIVFILGLYSLSLDAQDFNTIISSTCDSLAKKIIASGKKNVAVVNFVNLNNSVTELGTFMCEEVSSELSNKTNNQTSFRVIERTRLEQIIEEKKLVQYYNNNHALAMELGRTHTADILMFAIITEFEGYYRIVIKLLDTKDGDALSSYKMNLVKNHSLEELNKHIVVTAKNTPPEPFKPEPPKPEPPKPELEKGDICFSHQEWAQYDKTNKLIILLKPGNETFRCDETSGLKEYYVNYEAEVCARDIPVGLYTYIAFHKWQNKTCIDGIVRSETIRVTKSGVQVIIK